MPSWSRRGVAQAVAAPARVRAVQRRAPDNRITQEKRRPGTVEWQLNHYRFDPLTNLRSPQLEGYVSEVSAYPEQTLQFMVSTDPARKFTIDLCRTGYYGGAGGRHMLRLGPFAGEPQHVPLMGMERVRESAWKPGGTVTGKPYRLFLEPVSAGLAAEAVDGAARRDGEAEAGIQNSGARR